ncbi:pyridoxamine 5'-phosphate oxidase family protein [Streptomyces sannanensis]
MPCDDPRLLELLDRVPYGRLASSMSALPFVASARHIVTDGQVMLRMHAGFGYHDACDGNVVAYGADNMNSGAAEVWSLQFTGTARLAEPGDEELDHFGPVPRLADGKPFDPVYLRIEPQFGTLHSLDGSPERHYQHPE